MRKLRELKQPLSERKLKLKPSEHRSLQTYNDYVDLIQDTINGVLDKTIDRQSAHTVAILTGYGIQALREARGGKLKMSVFLNDMRRVNVEALSQEEMDRFLQGNENVQMEVLQALEDKGGIIEVEAKVVEKQQLQPKMDTKLISHMAGIKAADVSDALAGETIDKGEKQVHNWVKAFGGTNRFCAYCGVQEAVARVGKACSGEWGLI